MEQQTRTESFSLFSKARNLMTGGVNSPVRAFGSVGSHPIFIAKGKGPIVWDVDDHKYIDFCCSWGPMIHGHAHPYVEEAILKAVKNGSSFGAPTRQENDLAELIVSNHRNVDKIRFVSSGTEATMSAIRLARGTTGRDKIIKFEGCYHGHADGLLVKAGSGLATFGTSSSAGVPDSYAQETIVVPLNDLEAVEQAFENYKDQIACIIIEPIPANNGLLLQSREYLKGLKALCEKNGTLLIFDEVISGFRVGFEGAAALYNIKPDILCFGKIIGGGMPVGAYAASDAIMSNISPEGPVYQAGTLSGNPVAMAAGKAQLELCQEEDFYLNMARKTGSFTHLINGQLKAADLQCRLISVGSIFWFNFSKMPPTKASDIDGNMNVFNKFYHAALNRGLYFGPSGYEVGFVSSSHTPELLEQAAEKVVDAMKEAYSQ